ncbi:MAG: LysE family transporter [Chloroflexi bacterium]|nr:LysE family transporter [Chloroflexota bacterium]
MASPLLVLFAGSLMVGFSGALTPGPLLVVNITQAVRGGVAAGLWVATGHAAAELAVVFLLRAGLSSLVQRRGVGAAIGVVGGLVLVWLGLATVADAPALSLQAALVGAASEPAIGPFMGGILASVSNPYWLLWWSTVGAGYMVRSLQHGLSGVAAFYLGHILSDYSWYMLVAFIVQTGRQVISDSVYQGVLFLCGAFLVVLGAAFIVGGVRQWRKPPAEAN